jgi:hypothetical protein
MKHLSLILLLAVAGMFIKAQTGTTGVIINYKALENKLEKSNEDIENPKKNTNPKTWLSRGDLLLDIYKVHLQYIRKGMSKNELVILFGQPKEIQTRTVGQRTFEDYMYDRIHGRKKTRFWKILCLWQMKLTGKQSIWIQITNSQIKLLKG